MCLQVAADASFGVEASGSRAAALRASLDDELRAARDAAEAAAAGKLRAAREAEAAEAELAAARAEEAGAKVHRTVAETSMLPCHTN